MIIHKMTIILLASIFVIVFPIVTFSFILGVALFAVFYLLSALVSFFLCFCRQNQRHQSDDIEMDEDSINSLQNLVVIEPDNEEEDEIDLNIGDEEYAKYSECSICFNALKRVVFTPCGHCVCSRCSKKLKSCPFCRAEILNKTILRYNV